MKTRSPVAALLFWALALTAIIGTAAAQTPGGVDPAAVLAPGDPALTEGMVNRLTDFFEWVLQAPTRTTPIEVGKHKNRGK